MIESTITITEIFKPLLYRNRPSTELRLIIVFTKLNLPILTHCNPYTESNEGHNGKDVEPAKIVAHPAHKLARDFT